MAFSSTPRAAIPIRTSTGVVDASRVLAAESPNEWNVHRHFHSPRHGAPTVTILIPTHNEERRILATLAQLATFLHKPASNAWAFDILLVDDGTDSTAVQAASAAKTLRLPLKVVHFNKRLGKGGAVAWGIQRAKGGVVVLFDADAATQPDQIPKLLLAMHGPRGADVAVGSRHARGSVIKGARKRTRQFASRAFRTICRWLFKLPLRDTQCGFKAFRKTPALLHVLSEVHASGFEWDVELLARAHQAGLTLAEVPVEWHDKAGSTVKFTDTLHMLNGLIRIKRQLKLDSQQ